MPLYSTVAVLPKANERVEGRVPGQASTRSNGGAARVPEGKLREGSSVDLRPLQSGLGVCS